MKAVQKVDGMAGDELLPAQARRSLWVHWVVMGLVPLLLGIVACLIVAGGQTAQFTPRQQARLDDIGAGLLAIAALIFLGAFWFDGLWTFEPRLRRHCRAAVAEADDRQQALRRRAKASFEWLAKGARGLLWAGMVIPALAVVHAHLSGSLEVAGQLLVMGFLYNLFLASQFPRYLDVVKFVADPRNDPPEPAEGATGQPA